VTDPVTRVIVLCLNEPSEADRNAHKIATFLGADTRFAVITHETLRDGRPISALVPSCTCLVAAAETLAFILQRTTGVEDLAQLAETVAQHSFFYGFGFNDAHRRVLGLLSSGALVDIAPLSGRTARFQISDRFRQWCGQFTGLSLETAVHPSELGFIEGSAERQVDGLIRIAERPFFARLERSGRNVFFVGCTELADLDAHVPRHAKPLPWFSRLMPLMMFLRGAFGAALWHNDQPRACLIIDDPLLKSRYGFLDYHRLMESMRRRRFTTSIAFIPLNYRRSRSDVAAFVTSESEAARLSVSVHGCDHTDGEFATTHFAALHAKARTALDRMRTHRQLSGVPFDDVMVFPQGRFSAEGVSAVKANDYLATINGDVAPANSKELPRLRNWLEVAVTDFSGFPLFGRRYPRNIAEFAFDLFAGKPALAVEHHGYFENGYADVESFVDRVNALDSRLEWASLGAICSQACLTRIADDGELHVRFYTNRFTLHNQDERPRRYRLFVRRPLKEAITLFINGQTRGFDRSGDDLVFQLELAAHATADVRMSTDADELPAWAASPIDRAGVRVRRILSEFRDDYVDTTRSFVHRLIRRPAGRLRKPLMNGAEVTK